MTTAFAQTADTATIGVVVRSSNYDVSGGSPGAKSMEAAIGGSSGSSLKFGVGGSAIVGTRLVLCIQSLPGDLDGMSADGGTWVIPWNVASIVQTGVIEEIVVSHLDSSGDLITQLGLVTPGERITSAGVINWEVECDGVTFDTDESFFVEFAMISDQSIANFNVTITPDQDIVTPTFVLPFNPNVGLLLLS